MTDDDGVRCIHEILAEAQQFTDTEDREALPRLDQIATALRDAFPHMHIEGNDPQIIEAVAVGLHIATLRFAGYHQAGQITESTMACALEINGELLQALALIYTSPPAPQNAELMDMVFNTTPVSQAGITT